MTGTARLTATRRRRLAGEAGQAVPAHVFGVGLALLFFALLVQFVAWQYGRGAVRAALDEGARAGSAAEAAPGDCEQRARQVLGDLLGGAMGGGVSIRCAEAGGQIVAEAQVRFGAWLPVSPDWSFRVAASAPKEALP